MRRTIIIYGIAMAALLGLLKLVEYQYFVRAVPLEYYIGLVAIIFAAIGVWAGRRLTTPQIVNAPAAFERDEQNLERVGIGKREFEVLEHIALGLSNQEIADRLFVSTSTVKTHVSSVLAKLDASRRTQAIQRAKELRIIP